MSIALFIRTSGVALAGSAFCVSLASAADLTVIYTEIATSSTSDVPGARDLVGKPAAAKFTAMLGLAVRTDADEWVLRGFTDQGTDLQNILVRGTGTKGCSFMQEGQPVENTDEPGEVWDFFDPTPVSWNTAGHIAYSARARGGTTANNEKVFTYDGTTHTLLLTQGSPLTGLPSNTAPDPTCTNPLTGNSIGAVTMLDTGEVAWGNTPITGCSSFLYPAYFKNSAAFILTAPTIELGGQPLLSGTVGEECIEEGSYDSAVFTRDGLSFVWEATTNNPNTAEDFILVKDWHVLAREGSDIAGSGVILADVFRLFMATNDDWYARGDDPSDNDWALRNNVMLAKTGDAITTGDTELWGNAFSTFSGNGNGDWILVGNTNNPDTTIDTVIVLNGEEVLAREGDPVDVDGNGSFDDDAFINGFSANNVYLTDDMILYAVCTLRNGAGTALGDSFLRADLNPKDDCYEDIVVDGQVGVADLLFVISNWGPCPTTCPPTCVADITGDGSVGVADLLAIISAWGACP